MGFVNFLTYMKHLGEKALVFFPSKTDLISMTDKNGEVTEELLSERLDTLLSEDGDASNVTVTFQEATEKANIQSGDTLATAFAKLSKFCSDLETEINDNKDRLVNGDFKVQLDGSTLKARRTLHNPDGSTPEAPGYLNAEGFAEISGNTVKAGMFVQSGKNINTIYAPINNPTFTGTPKAPTPASNSNDTSLATTAFVKGQIGDLIGDAPETLDTLKEVADAIEEHKDVTDALNAAIGTKVSRAEYMEFEDKTNNDIELLGQMKVNKVTGKGLSTNDYTTAEKNKLAGIAAGAEVNTITGVKGNAESAYRTGQVNITPTNIGLGNVNNTADVDKIVKGVKDTTSGNTTTMNYGAAGLTTASWLAAWNGYELRAISPSNVRNVLKMPFMQKGTVTIAETNFVGECKLYYITDSIGFLSGTFRSISSFYISNRILFKITGLKFKDSRPHYIGSLAGRGFDSSQSLEVKTSFVIEATNKDEEIEIRFLAFDENTNLSLLSSVLYTVNCFISDVTWT